AYSLMNVKKNMVTPRSGEILIAAIQDFITGAYLLTHKDTFLNYQEICRLTASLIDDRKRKQNRIRLPTPAILKPTTLWTGKQLAELVFSDDLREFTLTAPNRSYTSNKEFCVKDSFVIIRNGRLISGVLDKALVGPGSKTSIFHAILRDFGGDAAADAM
ncbi:RNA polymerase Rpb1, domain 3, partial [Necator americanus]